MRTIKFRGQRLDNGEWVYGCIGYGFNQSIQYIMPKMYFATRDFGEVDENGEMIIEDEIAIGGFIPVKPETVGQFTGLQDKNGVDVYEGDVLFLRESPNSHHYIEFCGERCCFTDIRIEDGDSNTDYYGFEFVRDCEVVGNEFDNPELLTKN